MTLREICVQYLARSGFRVPTSKRNRRCANGLRLTSRNFTHNSTRVGEVPMALIECRDCGLQISSDAPACVRCGAPVQKPPNFHALGNYREPLIPPTAKPTGWAWVVIGLLGLALSVFFYARKENHEGSTVATNSIESAEVSPDAVPPEQQELEHTRLGRFGSYKRAANEI